MVIDFGSVPVFIKHGELNRYILKTQVFKWSLSKFILWLRFRAVIYFQSINFTYKKKIVNGCVQMCNFTYRNEFISNKIKKYSEKNTNIYREK
jgi:hypothetical protein